MMSMEPPMIDEAMRTLVRLAVDEDLGTGDKTVELAIPADAVGKGVLVPRKPGVIAGAFLIPAILEEYESRGGGAVACAVHAADGKAVMANQPIATLTGALRTILTAERTILNFLGRLSGVATLTRKYVVVVRTAFPHGGGPVICDTRKTTPGFRALEKFAVVCGGGVNHRMGLYDGVMLKDNHLAALRERMGGKNLAELTAEIRERLDPVITLWLEVDTLEQLRAAISGAKRGADIVLLDNFSPEQLREAARLRDGLRTKAEKGKPKILLEASGGITLENLAAVAKTGVDRISIGALTHSAPALDISMEFPS